MADAEPLKEAQRKHWNRVAEGWSAWFDWTERNFSTLTDWIRVAAGWQAGARVLDIGCGSGYPALTAARCVGPDGSVAAIDISPEMIAVAARKARAAGLDNIEFLEMDAEELRFEEGSFDSVTCITSLMFCPAPRRAVAEMHRVLAPGGRFAVAVWDDPSKNPFFTLIGGVLTGFFFTPPPDPAAPGPFRLARPEELESVVRAGGFSDFTVESRPMTVECRTVDEYWQIFMDVAGWKRRVDTLSEAESAQLRQSISDALQPHVKPEALRLAATALCASGRR